MSVPTNLIPTKITGLPEYTGTSQAGYFPYVLDGSTYKVQFSNIASAGEVPPSRTLTAGTGLVGGGDLSANRIFAIANGGVGANQLDTTGVVAGVYGNGSNVPTVTVDANGRVTSVTTSPVVATGYVPESRTITAGTGLIGGGSLANNITLSLNLSSATPQALGTATAGVSTAAARGDHVHPAVNLSDTNETQGALPLGRGGTGDALSPVAGAVVYSTGTKFALTNPGIPGQVLVSGGTDEPQWLTVAGLGTVTSVNASGGSTGMTFTGGPITTAGTLTLGGTLAVANGGTGATTASGARTNLGAAASGANSDITSLSGITGGIGTADFVAFDTSGSTPPTLGQLRWDSNDGTLDLGLNGGATLKVGQQTLFYAKNTSGGTIPLGTPVMFTGVVGASGKLTFGLAVANGSVPPEYMMGVTTQNVVNNDFGYITSFGLVRGFNTSGAPYGETWVDGDLLYFSPSTPGGWTKVEPQAPNIHVPVAVVVNAATGGSGSIFVRMLQSERLGELQDVEVNGGGPAAGQVLIYDPSQSRWENNTLTAGSNITITNGNGSITIAATEQFTGTVTSVAASGGTTGLTFSGSPITSAGTLTLGGTLAIGSGGTGATTAGGARTALGAAASGANTDITSIALTSGTILNAPTSGTDIVNKAYADAIASGINFHQSVRLATVAPLPANTYNNGTGGVGATLTANANGALSIDGVAVVAGNRVLVKNEAAQANNGVYVVTQTGSGSTPYILTRATDFDSTGTGVDQIDAGDFFLVTAGSTLANTSWVQQTPLPITVGTTAIVFSQFGAPVLYSAGTGLTLAGTVFSITNTGVTASTYGSASQVPVLAVNAQGQITSASNTSISIAASQVTSGSLAVARGGTGLSTTPTNGQLLIGNGTGYSLSTLSAGTGISVSNGSGSVTVTNTAPDQIVTITGGGATVVTGTYPNFTISSTTGTGTVTSVDVSGGTTGLSFTGGPITSSGIITMGGTLAVANGGTGVTTSTGTGSVVLNTSPTLVTPTLGAASATSIAAALGAVGTPSYTFTGDTNTGMWSPAADTIAFSTAGSERLRIDSSGNVGIGGTASTNTTLRIGKNLTGAVNTIGVYNNQAVQSDVTGNASLFATFPSTAAAAFTLSSLYHFNAAQGTIGATSAVTTQIGFLAQSSLTGATNNYGFYSAIASGTGRWNFYAAGTAVNYFEGNVGIGVTAPVDKLQVEGNLYFGTSNRVVYTGGAGNLTLQTNTGVLAFNTGGSVERMRVTAAGRVGVNTSNPLSFLGVGSATGQVGFNIGTSSSPERGNLWYDTDGTGWKFNIGKFQSSTFTAQMTFQDNGNVGIGTSSPSALLNVYSATAAFIDLFGDAGTTISAVRSSTDATGANMVLRKARGTTASRTAVASGDTMGTLFFSAFGGTNNRNIASIVGTVGTYTSDADISSNLIFNTTPTGSVTAAERARITSDGSMQLSVGGISNTHQFLYNESGGEIQLVDSTGAGPILIDNSGGLARFYKVGTGGMAVGTTGTGAFQFLTNGSERMRIDSSGNVGIGTSSPGTRLDVAGGSIRVGNTHAMTFRNAAGTGTATFTLQSDDNFVIYNAAGTPIQSFTQGASGFAVYGGNANNRMIVDSGSNITYWNVNGSERVRINSSGDVGIGTSAPSTRLTVAGTIRSTISGGTLDVSHDGTNGSLASSSQLLLYANGANNMIFHTNGSQRLIINSTGAITSSDLADAVGYKGIPQNAQTASYTLALSDIGKHISITTGGVVIPANGTVAFPIGSAVTIYNNSASNQTISITTDTLRLAGTATTGSRTLAQRGICTCVKVAATEWVISGAGLT